MSTRSELLQSVADIISDYREGEIPPVDSNHVNRWIEQFPEDVQEPMLEELAHVFDKTYLSRDTIETFLRKLVHNKKLCGDNARDFWKRANFLDIQQGGNSQHEMLEMFDAILTEELSLTIENCGSQDGPYIYLDDGVYNGGRIYQDIEAWLTKEPKNCDIKIIVTVIHQGGPYNVNRRLNKLQESLKIKVNLHWWRILELENRKYYKDNSDVLWPTATPDTPEMERYVEYITEEEPIYDLVVRSPGYVGSAKIFSSDTARQLLEDQFLLAGLRIRGMCPNLPDSERPLGHTGLKTLGFGATTVTFRNCPNNCPLAFWVGDPWYPLFPRKTNRDTSVQNFMKAFGDRF